MPNKTLLFTPAQQRRALGISAEAYEDLVLIECDRTFMSLTPGEVRRFYEFLNTAYRQAKQQAGGTPELP